MTADVRLRPLEEADVAAVAALCDQLGYPNSERDVQRRIRDLAGSADDAVFVAVQDGGVVGWIHLHVWRGVESGPDVEIGGLVVNERHRGAGIGRLLIAEADRWAVARGCLRVRLRSNITRAGAHAFYQRLGFRVFKTQYAFEKEVSGPGTTAGS
jgi:GNAT superfamily N-acetyltransferase